MEKYVVQIEFRYHKVTNCKSKPRVSLISDIRTIGIFDDFDSACNAGNNFLEEQLESRFQRCESVGSQRNRFNQDSMFGTKRDLVTNSGYLDTPFKFFAKITTLKPYDASIFADIDADKDECVAFKRLKAWLEDFDL
jgi:hypothetical protein